MKTIMTEDVVNEICKVCNELLEHFNKFSIFEGEVRGIEEEVSGFYPYGESIDLADLDFSAEAKDFLFDVSWFQADMALVFFVENDTIKMHFCHDSWDGFQPELSFTFKKTFDDDLFD